MKKFLSLVLALVMTMSLVTISAGAKDFTDDSKINYKEAVDVISAVKVVDGYEDGSFNPTSTLTRGAAAKIICNLILGPTTASALVADAVPYKDVPANSTFAGYIAFCSKEGIISGYADGTFRPGNTLTSYAFMKMLLGALGYDQEVEGYTGANWSINVAKRALNLGLDDGLAEDFNGMKAVTREEACLYALNTLQATMVEYGSKTTVSVGGAEVVLAGSKAEDVWNNAANETIKDDNKMQFAEKYFTKLVKDSTTSRDGFGRPATKWVYKGEEIGTYAEKADVTYAESVKLSDIYADLGMTTKDENAYLYENGEQSSSTLEVSKSNEDKLKDLGDTLTGNGSIVEVFRNEDTNHVDICVISVYVGEVIKTVAATKTKDAYVVIDNKTSVDVKVSYKDEFETDIFEEDDIVAFTYSKEDDEIKSITKLESVTGTLSKRAVGTSLTLDETEYKYAKNVAYGDGLTDDTDLTNKGEYTVYLDENGYALLVEETEAAIDSYALVTAVGSTFDAGKAKLVFADGTKKTVSTSKDYQSTNPSAANYVPEGAIVTYKVEADGDYKLTVKSNAINKWTTYDNTFKITKKDSAIDITTATVNGTSTSKIYADSSTVFVIQKGTDDFKVYTGIKNVPNVATANGNTSVSFLCKDGVKATIVFVSTVAANVTSNSSDILFVAGNSCSDNIVDADENSYYEYNAVINGKITTVKADTETTSSIGGLENGLKKDGSYYGFLFDNYSTDSDDLLQSASATFSGDVSRGYGIGIKKMTGEYSARVDTSSTNLLLTVAENANIFYVNDDGDITSITLNQVKTDGDDQVIYTMEDGEITNLFVIERS